MNIFLFLNESIGRRFLSLNEYDFMTIKGICIDKSLNDYNFYLEQSKKRNIKLFNYQYIKSKKFKKWILDNDIDLIFNIFSFMIIPSDIIILPKIGSFNLHPGKLPEYSGLNPISWSILNGEKNHYVTLHWITKKIDSGPIAYEKKFIIRNSDTAIIIVQKSVKNGLNLLNKLIQQSYKNSKRIPARNQNAYKRIYHSKEIPNNGFINWNLKADKISNFIRAFDYKPYKSFWLEPKIRYKNKIFNIIKVKISKSKSTVIPGSILISKNKILKISSLDKWIIINKIKLNKTFVDPLKYFTNGDKID